MNTIMYDASGQRICACGRHVTCGSGRLQFKTLARNRRGWVGHGRISSTIDGADELITMVTNTAASTGGVGFWETFLPAFSGIKPSEAALITSALLASTSVVMNFYSGISLENKKAELAI